MAHRDHPVADYEAALSPDAQFIDVREPSEVSVGTLPGAINIPLGQLPGRAAELVGPVGRAGQRPDTGDDGRVADAPDLRVGQRLAGGGERGVLLGRRLQMRRAAVGPRRVVESAPIGADLPVKGQKGHIEAMGGRPGASRCVQEVVNAICRNRPG